VRSKDATFTECVAFRSEEPPLQATTLQPLSKEEHPIALMPEESSKPPESSSLTSATEVPLPPEAADLYREVLVALNEHGVEYAVAGAFALQKYTGICRITKDLDLFIKPQDVPAALGYLAQHHFRCETLDPVWLSKAHRGEYFVDLISGMSNAAIIVDESWMARAQPAMIAGVQSRIIAAEDLVASKLFVTRRERFDGGDIAHIIYRTRGTLDWNRILELAGEHWEMVLWSLILFRYIYPAHSDYVPAPVWEGLLSRYVQLVRKPERKAPFRGSLVDENIFSIDVKDWGLQDIQAQYRANHLKKHPAGVRQSPESSVKAGQGRP
jgi:predicted nucleotidyltransferase